MKKEFVFGYISGAICSKGSIIYNKKKSVYMISFETGDKDLFNIFTEFWKSAFDGDYRTYEKNSGSLIRLIFRVYNERVARRFYYKYGFRTDSHNWKIPTVIKSKEDLRGFLSGFFDSGCYIRWRIRERGGKREKVRNIRIVSPNKGGLIAIKNALSGFGISPMIYSSGKNFCLDIEGKMKLELFEKRIKFLLGKNKIRLQEALSYNK